MYLMRYRILAWGQDVSWQYDAACLGVTTRTGDDPFFHPDTPKPAVRGPSRMQQAKLFCKLCKVKQQCLRFAVDNECTGIWGGTTERERKRLVEDGLA